jgi:AraC-like DNA-binding protein
VKSREINDHLSIRLFLAESKQIATWNTQNVRSPFWRFYQNQDSGAFIVLENGERFELLEQRVYFIPEGVFFSCGNICDFRHFYLHFDVIGLPSLTMRFLFERPILLPENSAFEDRVEKFAADIAAAPMLDLGLQCRAKSFVYEGLAAAISTATDEARARGLRHAEALEPVAPALRFIDANLSRPLRITELARLCFLSPDHFAKRFKACVGQTPMAYLQQRRIAQAAQRLLFSQDSMEQIARDCGFANRFSFSRVFTQCIGTPPGAYRKSRLV